jgi:hypothetical protein
MFEVVDKQESDENVLLRKFICRLLSFAERVKLLPVADIVIIKESDQEMDINFGFL